MSSFRGTPLWGGDCPNKLRSLAASSTSCFVHYMMGVLSALNLQSVHSCYKGRERFHFLLLSFCLIYSSSGRHGVAVTLVTQYDIHLVHAIEEQISKLDKGGSGEGGCECARAPENCSFNFCYTWQGKSEDRKIQVRGRVKSEASSVFL